MDEKSVEDLFLNRLQGAQYDDTEVVDVATFEDEDVLTDDRGVVLSMAGGEEFQIFIRQTKAAD